MLIAVLAYLIDKVFGEFRFIKHPVIIMGELITFFENHFYKDSIFRGLLLVVFVLSSVGLSAFFVEKVWSFLPYTLEVLASSIIASMFIAHKMLYDSVKDVLYSEDKKHAISMLVSRDTEAMSASDINKAAIETYAENLSDGVVAPIFYLLFFGLFGIIVYKAINTMDSMVGYKNERYKRFGKVAARLDDIANYIPSRITAVIIMLLAKRKDIFAFYKDGSKHESPNAGHPITAMAIVVGVRLGGDTSYFGKIKKKPFFGDGREEIMDEDVLKAINLGRIV